MQETTILAPEAGFQVVLNSHVWIDFGCNSSSGEQKQNTIAEPLATI